MRNAFILFLALFVCFYVYALWSDWFTRVEMTCVDKLPIYSDEVDLRAPGTFEWLVPREDWLMTEGRAHLSLNLNVSTLREIPFNRQQLLLQVKVKAEGRVPGGQWEDRAIRDWYFTTNEPFSKLNRHLWETSEHGQIEFGMAGVQVNEEEELRITIEITVPDGKLMWGNPRLKLVKAHDSAGLAYRAIFLRTLRFVGFWVSLGTVIYLAFSSFRWTTKPKKTKSTDGKFEDSFAA